MSNIFVGAHCLDQGKSTFSDSSQLVNLWLLPSLVAM